MERSSDVSIEDYLTGRRAMPHLLDLAPDLDDRVFPGDRSEVDAAQVAAMAREQGDLRTDLRLLVNDGDRYVAAATTLANKLRCDVYLPPSGANIRYVHESSTVSGESWDAIAVDAATGEPANWLVIRADDLPEHLPTWFVSARGRLRQSNGLVTVSLPDGLAFATKTTFYDTADLAARVKPGVNPVTTVAVNADIGRFEISRFNDTGALLGGVEFATLVAASLDLIHPDVQLPLTWPIEAAACAALDVELMRLADALNRTIWVPRPAGSAIVHPDCGEFTALDEIGNPSRWRAYSSRLAEDWQPRYGTDLDGRLAPLREVSSTVFPGVPFVSVPPRQLEHLQPWYESVAACEELFPIDLAVLPDGRLGVLIQDGRSLVIGGRELRLMLHDVGWCGEDLLLLAQPAPELWDATVDHARYLVNALEVDLWLPARGADVWAQPDGTLASDGPDGSDLAWHAVAYGRSEPTLPTALARARSAPPAETATPEPREPETGAGVRETEARVPETETASVDLRPVFMPASPTVLLATVRPNPATADSSHAVTWLPRAPEANPRPIDLFLWTPQAMPDRDGWAVPSPDLFLLAGRDPLRLAEHARTGHLLRVQAPQRSAVDLSRHASAAPASVRQRILDAGGTHLLPLTWLSAFDATARFDLDDEGGVDSRQELPACPLAIRFEGASHGVPGLPNDVVNWPAADQRADSPSYLRLPQDQAHRGFVALTRERPELEDGYRVLEVKVRRRRAIDIVATLDRLAGLPVAGRLRAFAGLDLALSEQDLSKAVVTKVWQSGKDVDKLSGGTLSEYCAPQA